MIESDYSLEAILFQTGDDFPSTLDNNFKSCIEAYPDLDAMNEILDNLGRYIKSKTGLNFNITTRDPNKFLAFISTGLYAHVSIPAMNGFNLVDSSAVKRMEALNLDSFKPESIVAGTIDNAKVTVSGCYSELKFDMLLYSTWFNGKLSADVITAVFLHELAHGWDFCTKVGDTLIISTFAAVATGQIRDGDLIENKIKIGNALLKSYGLTEKVDETNASASTVVALMLAGQPQFMQNRYGRRYESVREAERIADQFVNRWGRGRSLVKALLEIKKSTGPMAKIGITPRWSGIISNLKTVAYFPWKSVGGFYAKSTVGATTAGKVITGGTIAGTYIGVYMVIMTILAFALESLSEWMAPNGRHPDTIDRIKDIRADTVAYLKTDPDPEERKQALDDIAFMDEQIKEVATWTNLSSRFSRYIGTLLTGRLQSTLRERAETDLVNNPLFELTAILKGK